MAMAAWILASWLWALPCVRDCDTHCGECVADCVESCEERCTDGACGQTCPRRCSVRCRGCARFCERRLSCAARQGAVVDSEVSVHVATSASTTSRHGVSSAACTKLGRPHR